MAHEADQVASTELIATRDGRVTIPAQMRRATDVVAFTADQATRAGLLWSATHTAGLSLGDRACLSLATGRPNSTTLTADRAWAGLSIDTTIELVR